MAERKFDAVYNSLAEAVAAEGDRLLVVLEEMGNCQVCGRRADLRCGACFQCVARVDGRAIPGGHELWCVDRPEKKWRVMAQ